MFKYRRSAFALIGGGALALTSVVGLGSPAQAATGAEILVPISFGVSGTHVLPRTFTAGDCRQVGQNQASDQIPSYLTIERPTTIPDRYTITWNATLYTISTLTDDFWHAKFVFRSSAGPIATIKFDSTGMRAGTIIHNQVSQHLYLTPDQANSITFVDWIGDC